MGILRILGISHPITDFLEKELTEKAIKEFKKNDKTLPEKFSDWNKSIKKEVNSKIKEYFEVDIKQIKPLWKEFKSKAKLQIKKSILYSLGNSSLKNFSKEDYSNVVAIPYDLLESLSKVNLPHFLTKQIEFKNLDKHSINSLATYGINTHFDQVLNSLRSKRDIVHIDYSDYLIVDDIENDIYFINDETKTSRIRMIIFSKIYAGFSSNLKKERKKTIKRWKELKNNKRDNNRRFKYTDWE
ncbi:hypothetical protein C5S36_04320 [Candidatus Methanophagaceae archaeon]|nr:hypothetical protein C5S36_04320 [Methanophagales archaeon]